MREREREMKRKKMRAEEWSMRRMAVPLSSLYPLLLRRALDTGLGREGEREREVREKERERGLRERERERAIRPGFLSAEMKNVAIETNSQCYGTEVGSTMKECVTCVLIRASTE